MVFYNLNKYITLLNMGNILIFSDTTMWHCENETRWRADFIQAIKGKTRRYQRRDIYDVFQLFTTWTGRGLKQRIRFRSVNAIPKLGTSQSKFPMCYRRLFSRGIFGKQIGHSLSGGGGKQIGHSLSCGGKQIGHSLSDSENKQDIACLVVGDFPCVKYLVPFSSSLI